MSPSAPSRIKERKNERNLIQSFFKSQHDTFQCLTALHSLVTGALGGEAQHADAAARHQGRSKPWAKKQFGSNTGDLSEFSQYRRFVGFFSNTGGLSELPLKIQGLIFDEPTVFWYFGR